ncbi:MAG TPA: hypothetical protein DCO75_05415 [Fibrobacteres bacterium]|nr:hypothetical protein [Fibrobacterota bacterium]
MPDSADTTDNYLTKKEKPLFTIAVRSTLFILIAKTVRYGFVFLSQLILMNFLCPADFGLMRYVTIILGIVTLINEAGLGVALVQKQYIDKNETASSFSLVIIISSGLYGILFFAAPLLASFFSNTRLIELIRIGGLIAPLGGISIVHRSLMQRQFKYARLSLIETVSAVSGSLTGIIMGFLGFGVWSLVWSGLIYNSLSSILSIILSERLKGNFFNVKTSIPLWIFGLGIVIQRIIDYGASNADFLIVGKYFGQISLGIYNLAFMVMSIPQFALGAILANVAISTFSRFQDDNKRLCGAFIRLTRITVAISIPWFIIIFNLAPELMKAVAFINHGDKWIPAAPYIKILAPVGLIYCLNSYPGIVWIAKGKTKLRIIWAIFSLLTITAAVIAGSFFGVAGICKALLIRAIILFPVSLIINYRTFGLFPAIYLKSILPPLCCGAFTFIVMYGLKITGLFSSEKYLYLNMALECFVCLAVYATMIVIFSKNTYKDIRNIVTEIKLFV